MLIRTPMTILVALVTLAAPQTVHASSRCDPALFAIACLPAMNQHGLPTHDGWPLRQQPQPNVVTTNDFPGQQSRSSIHPRFVVTPSGRMFTVR